MSKSAILKEHFRKWQETYVSDLDFYEDGIIDEEQFAKTSPKILFHNTNTIKYVMKAGVLYDSETLDQIWPNKVKCPEWRMKENTK